MHAGFALFRIIREKVLWNNLLQAFYAIALCVKTLRDLNDILVIYIYIYIFIYLSAIMSCSLSCLNESLFSIYYKFPTSRQACRALHGITKLNDIERSQRHYVWFWRQLLSQFLWFDDHCETDILCVREWPRGEWLPRRTAARSPLISIFCALVVAAARKFGIWFAWGVIIHE